MTPSNRATPLGRVAEYLRQRRRMPGLDPELIGSVRSDPGVDPIKLATADLQFVLDSLDRIRNLAYRADPTSPFLPDTLATIFHLASGIAPGMPAPVGPNHVMAVTIKPDGGIYQDPTGGGHPYAAGGGGLRTRTCVHCGRRCGDVPGGSGIVNSAPVCYPPEGTTDRPNCYRRLLRADCTQVHVCQRGCWRGDS